MAAPASSLAEEVDQARDWTSLPAEVLQCIFRRASTSQAPGICLASLVCHTWWLAAGEPCSGMRLLYHTGQPVSDTSFANWLASRSQQVVALALQYKRHSGVVVSALVSAAAAAAAAGHPLPLHTLRVLGDSVPLESASQLLAALPHLRCLQLEVERLEGTPPNPAPQMVAPLAAQYQQQAGAIQAATQLEELYLVGPGDGGYSYAHLNAMAGLLPVSLKRLSWTPQSGQQTLPPLQHLSQLTFLQLQHWAYDFSDHLNAAMGWPVSNKLPPGLEELELLNRSAFEVEVPPREWRQAVTAFGSCTTRHNRHLPTFTKLRSATATASKLGRASLRAALEQAGSLSALSVHVEVERPPQAAAAAAAGGRQSLACRHPRSLEGLLSLAPRLSCLQRLHLDLHNPDMPDPTGIAALTGLQQLSLALPHACNLEQQRVWGREIGSMAGLRRLSVPDVLLEAEQAWLGGLQQLRVLALHVVPCWSQALRAAAFNELRMQWVATCTPQALPPRLQVLGWGGMTAAQAAAWGLRGRLQQALASSGCEVVVGFDVDQLGDPAQRLAGLPQALQQVLAWFLF